MNERRSLIFPWAGVPFFSPSNFFLRDCPGAPPVNLSLPSLYGVIFHSITFDSRLISFPTKTMKAKTRSPCLALPPLPLNHSPSAPTAFKMHEQSSAATHGATAKPGMGHEQDRMRFFLTFYPFRYFYPRSICSAGSLQVCYMAGGK